MDNKKMGEFILELRKSKQMTQKNLAEKLNITDKAVSKWERGLSYPDISLLPSIAEILGVTTGELLNGERNSYGIENTEQSIDNALNYADKTAKRKFKSIQVVCATAFSLLLFIGIVVCAICDIAVSGSFTWSWFPISSIIFAWLVFFPVIRFDKKGIVLTLIALSVLIVPFLYVLSILIKHNDLILPIGIRMSVIAVLFIWVIFTLFNIFKSRKLLAVSISLLGAIPVQLLINFCLFGIIDEPPVDVWDILSISILAILAIMFFIFDYMSRKNKE